MVAQQIRTIDFAAGIGFNKTVNSRSAIGMLQSDKFSSKISPLVKDSERNDQPIYVLDSTERRDDFGKKILGIRSHSTCNPSQSFYP